MHCFFPQNQQDEHETTTTRLLDCAMLSMQNAKLTNKSALTDMTLVVFNRDVLPLVLYRLLGG